MALASTISSTVILAASLVLLSACDNTAPHTSTPETTTPAPAVTNVPASQLTQLNIELVARGMTFEAPDTVPSGWVTINFDNQSPMVHFAVLEKLPDGKTIDDQQRDVAGVFQAGMDLLAADDGEAANQAFGKLPAWFGDIVFMGGPGLLSAGGKSSTTMFLEPGTYLLECYVKTNGRFHSYNPDTLAMVHQLTVTAAEEDTVAPDANITLSISREQGFKIEGTPVAGLNQVKVTYLDQSNHEHFLGHDVHVARLTDEFSVQALDTWMNWAIPGSLESPAPTVFLGGLHEMPAGVTGYFTVDLAPGRHAWIAEVPNAADKGMLKVFTVE